jgi:hypothetical protein
MKRLLLACLIFSFTALAYTAQGQIARKSIKKNNKRISHYRGQKHSFGNGKRYSSVGLSVNSLNYYGDMAPRSSVASTDISFTRPGVGLSYSYRVGPLIALQSQFMFGGLRGSDAESADKNDPENGVYRYKRNLSFRNRIKEFSVVAVFDMFGNPGNYVSRVRSTPYLYVGVAGLTNNPKALAPATDLAGNPLPEAGQWVALRPLGTEGQFANLQPTDANAGIKPYSLFQIAIPFGLGVRLRLSETMDLWADIGFRYTFTDYLDDLSQNYVDLGVLNSELARSMSYRTGELNLNPSNETTYVGRDGKMYTVEAGYGSEHPSNKRGGENENDIYMVTSIRMTYIIGATFHQAKGR